MGRAGRPLRVHPIFTGVFVAVLVLIPAASSKIFALGPLRLPGGTVVFPLVFILNDVLTEVYGYEASRRVIWTGLVCQLLAALTYLLVQLLPPAPFWPHQAAYDAVLGFAPRVAVASATAYLCGEFLNSYILSKMKFRQGGRRGAHQGSRFLLSTIAGEAADSLLFVTVAYAGAIPLRELVETLITLYVVKVLYEAAALPASLRFANWVKKVEQVDWIDHPNELNYNPFGPLLRSRRNAGAQGNEG